VAGGIARACSTAWRRAADSRAQATGSLEAFEKQFIASEAQPALHTPQVRSTRSVYFIERETYITRTSRERARRGTRVAQGLDTGSHLHAVNDRIRELSETFTVPADGEAEFVCECGCSTFLTLTLQRYDALHGAPVYAIGHPLSGVA
jgi:hypothetical protein